MNDSYKITIARVITFLLNLFSIYIIISLCNIDGEGLYSLITSTLAILIQISVFGIDQILLNKYHRNNRLYESATMFHSIILSPLVFLLFLPIGYVVYGDLGFSINLVLILAIGFIANTYTMFEYSKYIVKKEINKYLFLIISKPIVFVFFIFLFRSVLNLDINSIVIGSISGAWIFVALVSFFMPKSNRSKGSIFYYLYNWKTIVKYSGWVYLASLLFVLNSKGLVLMIKYFGDISKSGILFLAILGTEVLNYLPSAFGDIFLRDINAKKDKYEYFRYTYSKVLYILIFLGLVGVPLYYFSLKFLNERFNQAFIPFLIILPASIFLYSSRIIGSYLLSINKMYYGVISVAVNFFVVFISGIVLIKLYSINGAAISISLGYMASVMFDYVILIKEFGFFKFLKIFIHPRLVRN